MKWEVVLNVSIYRRESWCDGLRHDQVPRAEKLFRAPLANAQSQAETLQSLAQCVRACEQWLNAQGASLVSEVVVTVYSLEISDEAA